MHLESRVEPVFHPDSYGYRPGKAALDAVAVCRQRCWKKDWVIDLDVASFFDSVRHDLLVKAVEWNTDAPWVLLYVKRWLVAPLARPDGSLLQRDEGTPQGSAVSPVLANLFLHYAFDVWMQRQFPSIQFERYADDAVVPCVSERQARHVLAAIAERMEQVGLRLHPAKTRIVYCKDANRRLVYEHIEFTFLGFTFRPRGARTKDGRIFLSFQPAISKDALNKISRDVRRWRLHRWSNATLADLANTIRLDELLRGVLPLRDLPPSGAHQRLPGALVPPQARTVTRTPQSPPGVHRGDATRAPIVRTLAMGALRLVTRATRAV
jgi:RNA-directed DNA polymerase